jgi:hypothetical protein
MHATCFKIFRIAIAVITVASLGEHSSAEPPTSAPKLPDRDYPLVIDGTATMVGKWSCGGDAKVETLPARTSAPAAGYDAGVLTVVVTASVPAIECGDSKMNEHLRNALKMKDFPEIRYRANKYTPVDNGRAVQSSGELTIAGVTKPVELGATLIPLPEGGTRVVGRLDVNMLDYDVKPPSVFFGALRVAKTVAVNFDIMVHLPDEVTQSLFPDSQP